MPIRIAPKAVERPELSEHFGITTIEAMSYGCVPVVINAGGQPEAVIHAATGFLFNNGDELISDTRQCSEMFENDRKNFQLMSKKAYLKAHEFSREKTEQRFMGLLKQDGFKLDREEYLL